MLRHWPEAIDHGDGLRSQVLQPGGAEPAAGEPLQVRYRGHTLDGQVFASRDDGTPGFGSQPESFEFVPGTTEINDGLDSVIATMAFGETRVVVVPEGLAYGRGGFYGPGTESPRFVISPERMLFYEVEVLTR